MTAPMNKDLVSAVANSIVGGPMDELMGSRSDIQASQHQAILDALDATRNQELHTVKLEQETQKIQGAAIANQRALLDMEIAKGKAALQGIPVGQEPDNPQQPQSPPSGAAMTQALLTPDTNFSRSLINAIDVKRQQLNGKGERMDTEAQKVDDWLRTQIVEHLNRLDSDKSLARSPFGQLGGLLGGILDIVSGPADIGTALFGGKLSEDAKLELFLRADATLSPMVRAGMTDLLGRDRMEMTAQRYLEKRGLGGVGSATKSMDEANQVEAMAIDMRQTLADNLHDHFGANSTSGIGQAFNAYENIYALLAELKNASTPEQVAAIEQEIANTDATMREYMGRYTRNGGTEEAFQTIIGQAVDAINKGYQQPFAAIPNDAQMTNTNAIRKVTALDLTTKLHDFWIANSDNIPLSKEKMDRAMYGNAYTDIKKKYGEIPIYFDTRKVGGHPVLGGGVDKGAHKIDPQELFDQRAMFDYPVKDFEIPLQTWLNTKFMSKETYRKLQQFFEDSPNLTAEKRNALSAILSKYGESRKTWLKE